MRAEAHVAVDYFGVVALLGLEVEQARLVSARLPRVVLYRLVGDIPVIALGRQAVALQRVEIERLEPAPWP